MIRRKSLVLIIMLLVAYGGRTYLGAPTPVPNARPLAAFPSELNGWVGRDSVLPADIVQQTGADDYLNRYYSLPDERVASLYVSYYRSQRQGGAVHSPMNCLPGAGWQPLKVERLALADDASHASRTINKVVVAKGLDQQLVLYWYQSLNRVTASEYLSKAYLVGDAFRSGRTDIAMVRIVTPIDIRDPQGESAAFSAAWPFARAILPAIQHQLFGSL